MSYEVHSHSIPSQSAVAFKEWAAICHGLATGQQSLILRKGGIHEGASGFQIEHPHFWLYPTQFHQSGSELTPSAQVWLQQAQKHVPKQGFWIQQAFAQVCHVSRLESLEKALALQGLHGWSQEVIQQRFQYKQPGLFALIVRVFRRNQPTLLPESPRYGGCRSWVELDQSLATEDLLPALDDASAHRAACTIQERLG